MTSEVISPTPMREKDEARFYQLELFEAAKEDNTIILLQTGLGHNHITIMYIKIVYLCQKYDYFRLKSCQSLFLRHDMIACRTQ